MLPMLEVKRIINTIKHLVNGTMFAKILSASHEFMKIIAQETLLKHFGHQFASHPNQGVGLEVLKCQKRWPHNLQGSILQTNGGIGALEMGLKAIGQWSD